MATETKAPTAQTKILLCCAAGECGKTGPRDSEVSLSLTGAFIKVHCACWNESVEARQAERKAQLAAAARCEVEGCTCRGNYQARVQGDTVLICGRHLKKVQRKVRAGQERLGGLALFLPITIDREGFLATAKS